MADGHYPSADSQLQSVAARYGKTIHNGKLRIPCPAHLGGDDNLAISVKDGTFLVYCHSYECSFEDIIKALQEDGALPKQERPQRPTENPKRSKAEYHHADGARSRPSARTIPANAGATTVVTSGRTSTAGSRQQPRGSLRGFKVKLWADEGSGVVVVTEGEKAAMAVAAVGVAAYVGGAKNSGLADYSP